MALKEAIVTAILTTSPEVQGNKQNISELLNSQKNIISQVVESKNNPYKIDENLIKVAIKIGEKNTINYDLSKLPHTANNGIVYGNIDRGDYEEVVNSMYNEINGLKEKALKDSLITIGELYEFLNKNNQDLTEEDFGDLLYDYLEGDLTIESLKSKYNLDDKVLKIIKTDLLLGQEITSKELEKKAQQLEEEAKIKGITAEINQNSEEIQQNSEEIQQNSEEIQQNSDIIKTENRKQEEENRKQEDAREWSKASKNWQKDLDAMSKKLRAE